MTPNGPDHAEALAGERAEMLRQLAHASKRVENAMAHKMHLPDTLAQLAAAQARLITARLAVLDLPPAGAP